MKDDQKQTQTGSVETAQDLLAKETKKTSQNEQEPSTKRRSLQISNTFKPKQVIGKPFKDQLLLKKQESFTIVKHEEVLQPNQRSNQRGQTRSRQNQKLTKNDRANQSSRQNLTKKDETFSAQQQQQRLSRSVVRTETKNREQRASTEGRHLALSRQGLERRRSANDNQNNEKRFLKTYRIQREEKPEKYKEADQIKKRNQDAEKNEKRSATRKLSRKYSETREGLSKEKRTESINPERLRPESSNKPKSNAGKAKQDKITVDRSIVSEHSGRRKSLSKSITVEDSEKKKKKTGSISPKLSTRRESLNNSKNIEDYWKKEKTTGCRNLEHFGIRESLRKFENSDDREKKGKKSEPESPQLSRRQETLNKLENNEGRKKKAHLSREHSKNMNMNAAEDRKEEPSVGHTESAANEQQTHSDIKHQESAEESGGLTPNNLSSLENKDIPATLPRSDTSENNEIENSVSDGNKQVREDDQCMSDERHDFANSDKVELTQRVVGQSSSKDFQSAQAVDPGDLNDSSSQEETALSENQVETALSENLVIDECSSIGEESFSTSNNSRINDSVDEDKEHKISHKSHRDNLKEQIRQSCTAAQETTSAPVVMIRRSVVSGVWIDDNAEAPLDFNCDKDTNYVEKSVDPQIDNFECCSAASCDVPLPSMVCRETAARSTSTTESPSTMSDRTIGTSSQQCLQFRSIETDCVNGRPFSQTVSVTPETCISPPYTQALPLTNEILNVPACEDLPLTPDSVTKPFSHTESLKYERFFTPLKSQVMPESANRLCDPELELIYSSKPRKKKQFLAQENFSVQMSRDNRLNRFATEFESGQDPDGGSRTSSTSSFYSCISEFSPDSPDHLPYKSRDKFEKGSKATLLEVIYHEGNTVTRETKRVMKEIAPPSQCSSWKYLPEDFEEQDEDEDESRAKLGPDCDADDDDRSQRRKFWKRTREVGAVENNLSDMYCNGGTICESWVRNSVTLASESEAQLSKAKPMTMRRQRAMTEKGLVDSARRDCILVEERRTMAMGNQCKVERVYSASSVEKRKTMAMRSKCKIERVYSASSVEKRKTMAMRSKCKIERGYSASSVEKIRTLAMENQCKVERVYSTSSVEKRTKAMGNQCKDERVYSARRFKSSHSFYDDDREDISDYSVKSVPTEMSLNSFFSEDLNQDSYTLGLSSRYKGLELEPVFGRPLTRPIRARVENDEKLFQWNGDGKRRKKVSTGQHHVPYTFSDHDFEKCPNFIELDEPIFGRSLTRPIRSRVEKDEKLFKWNGDRKRRKNVSTGQQHVPYTFSDHEFEKCPNFIELNDCNYDSLDNASFDTRYCDYLRNFDNRMDRFLRKEYTKHELQCEADINELQYNCTKQKMRHCQFTEEFPIISPSQVCNYHTKDVAAGYALPREMFEDAEVSTDECPMWSLELERDSCRIDQCNFVCALIGTPSICDNTDWTRADRHLEKQSTKLERPVMQQSSVEIPFTQHLPSETVASPQHLVPESSSVEEFPFESSSMEEVPDERSSAEQFPFESSSVEELPAESSSIEEFPFESSSVEELPAERYSVEKLPVESSSIEELPVEKSSEEQFPLVSSSVEELLAESSSVEKLMVESSSIEELPVKWSSVEDLLVESSSVEEIPAESSSTEELPVERSAAEQFPLESSSAEELAVESSIAEQVPLENSSTKELPVESSTVEQIPFESSSVEELSAESSSAEELPVERSSVDQIQLDRPLVERLSFENSTTEELPMESSSVDQFLFESSSGDQLPLKSSSVDHHLPFESPTTDQLPLESSSVDQFSNATDSSSQLASPDVREESAEWPLQSGGRNASSEAQMRPVQKVEDRRQDAPKADKYQKESEADARSLELFPISDTGRTLTEAKSDTALTKEKAKLEIKARKKNYEEIAIEQFDVITHDPQTTPISFRHPSGRRTIFDPGTDQAAMEAAAAVSQRTRTRIDPSSTRRPTLDVEKMIAEQNLVSFTIPQVSVAPSSISSTKTTRNQSQIQFNRANLEQLDNAMVSPTEELLACLKTFSQGYRFRETTDMYTILSRGRALAAALEDFFQLFPSEECLEVDVPEVPKVPETLRYSTPLPGPTDWSRKVNKYGSTPDKNKKDRGQETLQSSSSTVEEDNSRRQESKRPIVDDGENIPVLKHPADSQSPETPTPSLPAASSKSTSEEPKATKSHQALSGERRPSSSKEPVSSSDTSHTLVSKSMQSASTRDVSQKRLPDSAETVSSSDGGQRRLPGSKQQHSLSDVSNSEQSTLTNGVGKDAFPDSKQPVLSIDVAVRRLPGSKQPVSTIDVAIRRLPGSIQPVSSSDVGKGQFPDSIQPASSSDVGKGPLSVSKQHSLSSDVAKRRLSDSKQPVLSVDVAIRSLSGSKQPISSSDVAKRRLSDSKQPVSSSDVGKGPFSDSKQPVSSSNVVKRRLSDSKQPVSSSEVGKGPFSDLKQPVLSSNVVKRRLSDSKQPVSSSDVGKSPLSYSKQPVSSSDVGKGLFSDSKQPVSSSDVGRGPLPDSSQPVSSCDISKSHPPDLRQQDLSNAASKRRFPDSMQPVSSSDGRKSHLPDSRQPVSSSSISKGHLPDSEQPVSSSEISNDLLSNSKQPMLSREGGNRHLVSSKQQISSNGVNLTDVAGSKGFVQTGSSHDASQGHFSGSRQQVSSDKSSSLSDETTHCQRDEPALANSATISPAGKRLSQTRKVSFNDVQSDDSRTLSASDGQAMASDAAIQPKHIASPDVRAFSPKDIRRIKHSNSPFQPPSFFDHIRDDPTEYKTKPPLDSETLQQKLMSESSFHKNGVKSSRYVGKSLVSESKQPVSSIEVYKSHLSDLRQLLPASDVDSGRFSHSKLPVLSSEAVSKRLVSSKQHVSPNDISPKGVAGSKEPTLVGDDRNKLISDSKLSSDAHRRQLSNSKPVSSSGLNKSDFAQKRSSRDAGQGHFSGSKQQVPSDKSSSLSDESTLGQRDQSAVATSVTISHSGKRLSQPGKVSLNDVHSDDSRTLRADVDQVMGSDGTVQPKNVDIQGVRASSSKDIHINKHSNSAFQPSTFLDHIRDDSTESKTKYPIDSETLQQKLMSESNLQKNGFKSGASTRPKTDRINQDESRRKEGFSSVQTTTEVQDISSIKPVVQSTLFKSPPNINSNAAYDNAFNVQLTPANEPVEAKAFTKQPLTHKGVALRSTPVGTDKRATDHISINTSTSRNVSNMLPDSKTPGNNNSGKAELKSSRTNQFSGSSYPHLAVNSKPELRPSQTSPGHLAKSNRPDVPDLRHMNKQHLAFEKQLDKHKLTTPMPSTLEVTVIFDLNQRLADNKPPTHSHAAVSTASEHNKKPVNSKLDLRPSQTSHIAKSNRPEVRNIRQMDKEHLSYEKQLDKHKLTTPRASKQEITRTFDQNQRLADNKPPTHSHAAMPTAIQYNKKPVIHSDNHEKVSGFNGKPVKSISPNVNSSKTGVKIIVEPDKTTSELKVDRPKAMSRNRAKSGHSRHPECGEEHKGQSSTEHKKTLSVPLSDQPGKHLNESFIFVPNPALLTVSSPVLMGTLLHAAPQRVASSPSIGRMSDLDIEWENQDEAPLELRPILKRHSGTSNKILKVFFNPEVEVQLFSDDDSILYVNDDGFDYAIEDEA